MLSRDPQALEALVRELEHQLAELAARQTAVARLGLRVIREQSLDALLDDAVATVREILQADRVSFFELDDASEQLLLRAGSYDESVVSGVSVVVHGSRGALGVLGAHTLAQRDFSEHDVHLLQAVANVITAAVERACIEEELEQLRRRAASAQAEAEVASRVKSEFLGMMSHELRTPLNAIGGFAQLMEEEVSGPINAEQRSNLGRIRRSQGYLLHVIENVLSFVKQGSGRVHYTIEDLSLQEVIGDVEEMIRPLLYAKQLSYECVVDVNLRVNADRDKLQQVVLNLLSNATKFTSPGGCVRIDCHGDDATVELRVHDSGCGISAHDIESVFEPFTQVTTGRARVSGGTGLGLTISRDFARGMGGELRVESELEKGSTFTVVLPRGRPSPLT